MKVIPVIDLQAGQVVHARRGERDSYRPIESALCRGSHPLDIVAGLLGVYPFDTIYIADLDAIRGRGDHRTVIAELGSAHQDLQLWVDCGRGDAQSCRAWLAENAATLVLGSEAVEDARTLRDLRDMAGGGRLILSLDFRDERFIGPPEWLDDPETWPERVIVMTLGRVGSGAGPDLARLDDLRRRAPRHRIFAAGGVRDGEDLVELTRRGVDGVLVATALHDRRIGRVEIAAVAGDAA